MSYRTKRPRLRSLLVFGAGATLAMTQLGAGCVPANRYGTPDANDAGDDAEPGDTADASEPGDDQ